MRLSPPPAVSPSSQEAQASMRTKLGEEVDSALSRLGREDPLMLQWTAATDKHPDRSAATTGSGASRGRTDDRRAEDASLFAFVSNAAPGMVSSAAKPPEKAAAKVQSTGNQQTAAGTAGSWFSSKSSATALKASAGPATATTNANGHILDDDAALLAFASLSEK